MGVIEEASNFWLDYNLRKKAPFEWASEVFIRDYVVHALMDITIECGQTAGLQFKPELI